MEIFLSQEKVAIGSTEYLFRIHCSLVHPHSSDRNVDLLYASLIFFLTFCLTFEGMGEINNYVIKPCLSTPV